MRRLLLSVFVVCVILVPNIYIGDTFGIRPEWLMLPLFFLVAKGARKVGRVEIALLVLLLLQALSTVYGILMANVNPVPADAVEVLKPGFWLVAYMAISRSSEGMNWRAIGSVLCAALMISALLMVAQYVWSDWLMPVSRLYRRDDGVLEAYVSFRSVGTFGNPNIAALAMVFGILFVVGSRWIRNPIARGVVGLSFVVALISTGSRTGWVAALVGLSCLLIAELWIRRSVSYYGAFIVVLVLLGLAVTHFSNLADSRLFGRASPYSMESMESFRERRQSWSSAITEIKRSPILGVGANKGGYSPGTNIDNEFLLIIYRYGLVGFIAFCAVLYNIWRATLMRLGRDVDGVRNRLTFTAITLASLVFASAATFVMNFRLFFMFLVLSAILSGTVPHCRPFRSRLSQD